MGFVTGMLAGMPRHGKDAAPLLARAGIDLIPLPSLNIDSFAALDLVDDAELLTHFHVRVKSGSGLERQDVALMHRLHARVLAAQAGGNQP